MVDQRVIDTILAEAGGSGVTGMAAVAHVINNRANAGNTSPGSVVSAPHQFEGYSHPSAGGRANENDATLRQQAEQIWEGVTSGSIPDPTGGAVNYFGSYIAPPSWAQSAVNSGHAVNIGGNIFLTQGTPASAQDVADAYAPSTGTNTTPASDAIDAATNGTASPSNPYQGLYNFGTGNAGPSTVPLSTQTGQPVPLAPFKNSNPFAAQDQHLGDVVTGDFANLNNANPNLGALNLADILGMDPVTLNGGSSAAPTFDAQIDPKTAQMQALDPSVFGTNQTAAPIRAAGFGSLGLGQGGLASLIASLGPTTKTPSYFNTGQGIAGTAQLPAGYHPPAGLIPSLDSVPNPTSSHPATANPDVTGNLNAGIASYFNDNPSTSSGAGDVSNSTSWQLLSGFPVASNMPAADLASIDSSVHIPAVTVPKYIDVKQRVTPADQPIETTPDATWVTDPNDPNGGYYKITDVASAAASKPTYTTVKQLNPKYTQQQKARAAAVRATMVVPAAPKPAPGSPTPGYTALPVNNAAALQKIGLSAQQATAYAAGGAKAQAANPVPLNAAVSGALNTNPAGTFGSSNPTGYHDAGGQGGLSSTF